MKPGRIILSVVLCVIAIVRLASTCNKMEKREKAKAFAEGRMKVEQERQKVLMAMQWKTDSLSKLKAATRGMNDKLDSCIQYYQDHYGEDEERNKEYLQVFFVYKKMVYLYQGWYRYMSDSIATGKGTTRYAQKQMEFQREHNNLLMDASSYTLMSGLH